MRDDRLRNSWQGLQVQPVHRKEVITMRFFSYIPDGVFFPLARTAEALLRKAGRTRQADDLYAYAVVRGNRWVVRKAAQRGSELPELGGGS